GIGIIPSALSQFGQTLLQQRHSMLIFPLPQALPLLLELQHLFDQPLALLEESVSLQLWPGDGRILQFAQQVGQALLLRTFKLLISAVEVADQRSLAVAAKTLAQQCANH